MAQKMQVQYIRYYTDGSAARKLAPVVPQQQEEIPLPRQRRVKRKVLYVDPLPAVALLLAGCMLILMAVGFIQLMDAKAEIAAMEAYVEELTEKNASLSAQYQEGYDLERVRQTALALDMVPAEQVQSITIMLPAEPAQPEQVTLWQQIGTFLAGLFA